MMVSLTILILIVTMTVLAHSFQLAHAVGFRKKFQGEGAETDGKSLNSKKDKLRSFNFAILGLTIGQGYIFQRCRQVGG